MYEKILVPLDHSMESEGVLPYAEEVLNPGGEGILLHIIPPDSTGSSSGEFVMRASQVEEEERAKAMARLREIGRRMSEGPSLWRCEVAVSTSVADGIADVARREQVDLIAMYTHDRKGLAKLFKGSIAEKIQKRSAAEVQVLGPRELVAR